MNQATSADSIVVTAIQARTPVGANIATSAAAIRAGIGGFREHPDYCPIQNGDDDGDDTCISAGIDLSISDFGWQRLVQLIEGPFHAFIADSGLERKRFENGALWFALPNADPVVEELGLQKRFLDYFSERFSLPKKCNYGGVNLGAVGVGFLIDRARKILLSGEREFVIVAAVDSFMLDGRLGYYDDLWRLKSQRNPAGFIPGEAAAIVLIETASRAKARQASPLLTISGVGSGQESNPISGDKSSTGVGLSQAIEQAMSHQPGKPVHWLFSDLNGESYRAYEWGVTSARLNSYLAPQLLHVHPADSIGDVGSANTAVQLGCVSEAFRRDCADDAIALLLSANDDGRRGALCVSRPAA